MWGLWTEQATHALAFLPFVDDLVRQQQSPSIPPTLDLCLPVIDWQPDYAGYCDRVKRNKPKRRGAPIVQLPAGYPEQIHSPLAWTPANLREQRYIFQITTVELLEAEAALKAFKGKPIFPKLGAGSVRALIQVGIYLDSSQPLSAISRTTFPLPNLGPRIVRIARQLEFGCGFFVLRGFDPKKYSSEENIALYAGIASYVGDKRSRQDENGCMLREYHIVAPK